MEGNIPRSAILLGLAFLNLGTGASAFSAFWPIKNVDFTNGGSDCKPIRLICLHSLKLSVVFRLAAWLGGILPGGTYCTRRLYVYSRLRQHPF